MTLKEFLDGLNDAQLAAYACRAGTSSRYLRSHVRYASRGASLRFMRALARASGGKVSLVEVLMHFGVPLEELRVA